LLNNFIQYSKHRIIVKILARLVRLAEAGRTVSIC
jgi:hypothetical protein